MLTKTTGLKFRLLSLSEAVEYTFSGVSNTINIDNGLIIEIGGGSTQIIEFSNNEIINYLNIDIGSIIATEKYIASNKISELKEFIKSIIIENPWISKSNAQIIGVGGIIRTISRIDMKTDNYPLNLIHNYNMNINL